MSELRKLIEDAAAAIATYKHPDTSECRKRLDKVITASGLGSIGNDALTDVAFSGGKVVIETAYSVLGCEQSDRYEFPESIIDAAHPVKAAALWGLERRVKKAEREVKAARNTLSNCEAELSKAETALRTRSQP